MFLPFASFVTLRLRTQAVALVLAACASGAWAIATFDEVREDFLIALHTLHNQTFKCLLKHVAEVIF